MNILLFAIVVLLVLALVLWAIRMLPVVDGTIKQLIQVIAVIIAALAIAQRAGLF